MRPEKDRRNADLEDQLLEAEGDDHQDRLNHAAWRPLFREMWDQGGPLAGGVILVVLATAAALFESRLLGIVVDDAILPRRWDLLRRWTLVYFAVICLRAVSTMGQAYLFEVLGQRVTQRLRCALYSHLQRVPLSVFDRNPAGRLLTRVTNDVAAVSEMFSAGFVSMLSNALMVLGIVVWLFVLDPRLAGVACAILPALLAVSAYFSARLRVAYRDARSRLSSLNAFLAENLFGMRIVNLFNRQSRHIQRFERINQWYADAQIASIRVFALFQPAITLASGLAIAAVIWVGGRRSADGTLSLGVLTAFFSFVLALFQPLRELADKWNVFLSGLASAERIYSILRWPTEMSEAEVAGPAPIQSPGAPAEEIVFEGVWFAYQAEDWVLKDFSLRLKAGEKVGVVGHTGAGKSTVIGLLLRFYEPQRGRILWGGRDIREIDRRELRSRIGLIQQDVFLFSGSLRDNVTFWGAQAAAPSDLREFEGLLDRPLQERGANLSLGERQLVAFARAQAKNPSVWVLDEATSSLDSETEARLQASMEAASRGRTVLLVAHRLATIRGADRIVVLHRGVSVEQGSHAELMQLDGLYARLYRYQSQSV